MLDLLLAGLDVMYNEAGIAFEYDAVEVLLMRDSGFEVENTKQTVFRGRETELSGIANGDEITMISSGLVYTVINTEWYGDYKEEILISVREGE